MALLRTSVFNVSVEMPETHAGLFSSEPLPDFSELCVYWENKKPYLKVITFTTVSCRWNPWPLKTRQSSHSDLSQYPGSERWGVTGCIWPSGRNTRALFSVLVGILQWGLWHPDVFSRKASVLMVGAQPGRRLLGGVPRLQAHPKSWPE